MKLNIANAKQLSKKQKAGTPLTIKCDVDIDNVSLWFNDVKLSNFSTTWLW